MIPKMNTAKDLDLDKEIEKNTNQFRVKTESNGFLSDKGDDWTMREPSWIHDINAEARTVKEGSFIKGINADGDFTGEKVYLLPLRTEADGKDNFTGNVSGPQGSRSII